MSITIPVEVIKGFAEYGVNFFAIQDYTNKIQGKTIFCIAEQPFNIKAAAKWEPTPKANIAKKMLEFEGKAAPLAQMFTGKDYTMLNAGVTTYSKYASVDRQTYTAQINILNTPYPSSKDAFQGISTAAQVENFLANHAIPLANDNISKTLVETFKDIAVDTPRKITDIMGVIKDTAADPADKEVANGLLECMMDCSARLRELVHNYETKYKQAIETLISTLITEQLNSGKKLSYLSGRYDRTYIKADNIPKFSFETTTSGDDETDEHYICLCNSKFEGGGITGNSEVRAEKELTGVQDFASTLDEYSAKLKDGDIAPIEVQKFYTDRWTPEAGVKISAGNDFWVKILTYFGIEADGNKSIAGESVFIATPSSITYMKALNDEFTAECEKIKKEALKEIAVFLKDKKKIKESKSKVDEVADRVLQGLEGEFGKFNHRISPCILYFSFAGMIFKEHVNIESWSETQDTWGFNTKFNINMVKAEISTYGEYFKNFIQEPI